MCEGAALLQLIPSIHVRIQLAIGWREYADANLCLIGENESNNNVAGFKDVPFPSCLVERG